MTKSLKSTDLRYGMLFLKTYQIDSVVFNLESRSPEGSWTIFGGAAGSFLTFTAVLHLLYWIFRWGSSG